MAHPSHLHGQYVRASGRHRQAYPLQTANRIRLMLVNLEVPYFSSGVSMESAPLSAATKNTASGIVGYGGLTGVGLPHGRSTLPAGGSGFGKTIFALRRLVDGARDFKGPGIFVASGKTIGLIGLVTRRPPGHGQNDPHHRACNIR